MLLLALNTFHLILGLFLYRAYFADLEDCASPIFVFLRLPGPVPHGGKPIYE